MPVEYSTQVSLVVDTDHTVEAPLAAADAPEPVSIGVYEADIYMAGVYV